MRAPTCDVQGCNRAWEIREGVESVQLCGPHVAQLMAEEKATESFIRAEDFVARLNATQRKAGGT